MRYNCFLVLMLLLILLLITACTQRPAGESKSPLVEQPTVVVQKVQEEKINEPAPAPVEEKKRSPSLERLLKETERVKSYQYLYNSPPLKQSQDMVYVRGDKMRIDLMQSDVTLRLPYTTVFIDHKNKKAAGYCLDNPPRCKEKGLGVVIDYNAYFHPTSIYWLELVKQYATDFQTSEIHDEKKTKGTIFEVDGVQHTVYLDSLGMPVRAEVGAEGKQGIFNYRNLVINSVSEEYVTPPAGYG